MENWKICKYNFLCASLALVVSSQAYATDIIKTGTCGKTYDDCHYNLDSEGNLIIQGNGEIKNSAFSAYNHVPEWATIKNIIIENGITRIGSQAFADDRNVQNISLPHSLKSIGFSAFYASALKNIEIPSSVDVIESNAFKYSRGLRDVTIKGKNVNISDSAFCCGGLTSDANTTSKISCVAGSKTEKQLKNMANAKVSFFRIPKRKSYTIKEANEASYDGNNNTITFSW